MQVGRRLSGEGVSGSRPNLQGLKSLFCERVYPKTLQQAIRDVTVQVDFLSYAAVSCGDDDWLAILNIGDMAEECLIKDGMDSLPVVLPSSSAALDFCSGSHSVLALNCTPKTLGWHNGGGCTDQRP